MERMIFSRLLSSCKCGDYAGRRLMSNRARMSCYTGISGFDYPIVRAPDLDVEHLRVSGLETQD